MRCPVLVLTADADETTRPTRRSAPPSGRRTRSIRYPIRHFEIYVGEAFERAVAAEADFLSRHLLDRPAPLLRSAILAPEAESPL